MSPARKRGPGRPRLPRSRTRSAVLSLRLTAVERSAVETSAQAAGRSASDWERDVLLAAAISPANANPS